MPELPEVETTVSGLRRYAESQTIRRVVFHRDAIRYPLETTWIKHIEGNAIRRIDRRAKLIIMTLDNGCLLWHLGMTGSLRVSRADEAKRKHDHVVMELTPTSEIATTDEPNDKQPSATNQPCLQLRFHDPRRFGYLKWFADAAALQDSIAHYGVEPLSDAFNANLLWHLSRNKAKPVKHFIMDQAVVVGIGNIYACEALFIAGIRPQTPCGKIGKVRYRRLVTAAKDILRRAINRGGTTLKDFINAEAEPGYFQQSLLVYGRQGEPCPTCQQPISNLKLGGRSSFYCRHCQR